MHYEDNRGYPHNANLMIHRYTIYLKHRCPAPGGGVIPGITLNILYIGES